jgi:alkylmercury lyase
MNESAADIDRLATAVAQAMSKLVSQDVPIALAIYRLLAKAEPVHPSDIATEAGVSPALVEQRLSEWPGVFEEDGAVVGFWGLAIPEMSHRFEVDDRTMHTWCAYDALFIPELIGKTAKVRSSDPSTGEEITLTVSSDRIETAQPETIVMSFLDPATTQFDENVILNFCNYVHFFSSTASGSAWVQDHPGTFLLSLEDALRLAHQANRATFGVGLSVVAGA